jgi:hypothetical protein
MSRERLELHFPSSAPSLDLRDAHSRTPAISVPFQNLVQEMIPDMPIVPDSRTICIVRPGAVSRGDACRPQQCGHRVQAAGQGEFGRRPPRPATTGRAGACYAKGISGIDRGDGGHCRGSLGAGPVAASGQPAIWDVLGRGRVRRSVAVAHAANHLWSARRPDGDRTGRRQWAAAWPNVPAAWPVRGTFVPAATATAG